MESWSALRRGVVAIALHAEAPILTVTIRGGNRVWPQGQRYPRIFRQVPVIYHPLLYIKKQPDLDTNQTLLFYKLTLREIIAEGSQSC